MSNLVSEISVTIKDENCKITEKDIAYSPIYLTPDDPFIKELINKALSKFKAGEEEPSIIVKAKLIVQS